MNLYSKKYLVFTAIPFFLFACNKNNSDSSYNQSINCSPLQIDPLNLNVCEMDTTNNIVQFVYPAIELQKKMTGNLVGMNMDSIKKYQFHVYVFAAGRYYLLPSTTTGSNKYGFTIEGNASCSTVSIARVAGVTENFIAIKVIGVKFIYLQKLPYTIDYTDFASVQKTFALP